MGVDQANIEISPNLKIEENASACMISFDVIIPRVYIPVSPMNNRNIN